MVGFPKSAGGPPGIGDLQRREHVRQSLLLCQVPIQRQENLGEGGAVWFHIICTTGFITGGRRVGI